MWVDDVPNVCEKDDFIYHELLVHVPMMTHPKPTRALIIGGGDGGSARELLKHPGLENAVMIDIDEVIINLCKKHLPMVNDGAFDNPNLNLIIGDGIDYVKKQADGSFDVIIVDSTDPVPGGVGEVLFTKDFYEHCFRILSPNGVISTQALMPLRYDAAVYKNSMANLQHAFGEANTYVYFAPTDFYGGLTSFSLCFKEGVHPKRVDKERIKSFSKEKKLKYYNHNMHMSSLCLPGYVREMLYGKS
jgi:spermidine synthase